MDPTPTPQPTPTLLAPVEDLPGVMRVLETTMGAPCKDDDVAMLRDASDEDCRLWIADLRDRCGLETEALEAIMERYLAVRPAVNRGATTLLHALPAEHPDRNRPLVGCYYRWRGSRRSTWKRVTPNYAIARHPFNALGEAWTRWNDWSWKPSEAVDP